MGTATSDETGPDPSPYPRPDSEVTPISVSLLLPQFPGSRRVVPLVITDTQVKHLRELLEQSDRWVGRARWVRWLDHGDLTDTTPIEGMLHDDRVAACSWLRQQRHVLYDTVEGGRQAPGGWIEARPLYRGLSPNA